MKIVLTPGSLFLVSLLVGQPPAEAPAGFDDKSNGMVDEPTHQSDREALLEILRSL